jgi:hypothetical protein
MEGSLNRKSNNTAYNIFAAVVLISILSFGFNAKAAIANDDSEVLGYDSIVNDLNREAARPVISEKLRPTVTPGSLESLTLHLGVGIANLMEMISLDDGTRVFLGQRGVQIAGGIDLFSPNWQTEGTYRNFGESEEGVAKVTMQEWELKFLYKDRIQKMIGIRAGGGLSARYMSVRSPHLPYQEFTTPSTVATIGVDTFVSEGFSIGADLTGRSAMVTETPDRNSIDVTLRMDTHF